MRFQHFLLTRFNVGLYSGAESAELTDRSGEQPSKDPDGWMDHRLKLFEKYCIPSVKNQSNKKFNWLVVFDEKTPSRFKNRIERYSDDCGLVPLYSGGTCPTFAMNGLECRERVLKYITNELNENTQYIITTRIDNDDAIHSEFIRSVQECVPSKALTGPGPCLRLVHRLVPFGPLSNSNLLLIQFHRCVRKLVYTFARKPVRHQGRIAVNFTCGYALQGRTTALVRSCRNQFISLIEQTGQPGGIRTVWATEHKWMRAVATVRELDAEPMWVMVIHDRNLLNQFEGEQKPVAGLSATFGFSP